MLELILMVLVMAATAAFFYWLGWDNRGDVEENRRWDAGCRCDIRKRTEDTTDAD